MDAWAYCHDGALEMRYDLLWRPQRCEAAVWQMSDVGAAVRRALVIVELPDVSICE
jgi:hypothetical protein